jgi:hypothetical protein
VGRGKVNGKKKEDQMTVVLMSDATEELKSRNERRECSDNGSWV